MIPGPWVAVLLVLAAFRLVRLIGWDDLPIIERARGRLTLQTLRHDMTKDRDRPIVTYRRPVLAHFLGCAFCQGFWTSAAVYLAWILAGHPGAAHTHSALFYALMPFALSSAVGLIARNLDP